jgi:hypothetical protein
MKIADVAKTIGGNIVCGDGKSIADREVWFGFSSDLMSDVLTINNENILLITGLANIQAIRTAEMADIQCIVFARNKKVTREMIELAKANNMVIIECEHSVFNVSGKLFQAGLKALY